jgi:protein gp37
MSAISSIEWTDRTWNPVRGCSRVSQGCRNCYAERVAYRFSGAGMPYEGLARKVNGHASWTGVLRHPTADELLQPLSWRKPSRIFVNSMSDLFHEALPDEVFAVMALAQRHTFQVLTKRPQRMLTYLRDSVRPSRIDDAMLRAMETPAYPGDYSRPCLVQKHLPGGLEGWPLPNVWLGVSVEDQGTADARIPLLLETPAAVRFVSAEPLLAPLNLAVWLPVETIGGVEFETWLDWVIVGGESGPGARPCEVAWVDAVVRQCRAAEVPVFVKQLGAVPLVPPARLRHWEWGGEIRSDRDAKFTAVNPARTHCEHWRVHLDDRKGGDPAEWPKHLRVRQFPGVGQA